MAQQPDFDNLWQIVEENCPSLRSNPDNRQQIKRNQEQTRICADTLRRLCITYPYKTTHTLAKLFLEKDKDGLSRDGSYNKAAILVYREFYFNKHRKYPDSQSSNRRQVLNDRIKAGELNRVEQQLKNKALDLDAAEATANRSIQFFEKANDSILGALGRGTRKKRHNSRHKKPRKSQRKKHKTRRRHQAKK